MTEEYNSDDLEASKYVQPVICWTNNCLYKNLRNIELFIYTFFMILFHYFVSFVLKNERK